MRIGVVPYTQNPLQAKPQRYVKKSAADCLVRRLLAVRVSKALIMLVPIRETAHTLPAEAQHPAFRPMEYQHHIEPRIEHLTIADSPWLRYLQGMEYA